MATPQILADIGRLLIQLMPAMALVCLVLAGIALRLEGGSTFSIGGGFTKWILWCVILVTLPQLPRLRNSSDSLQHPKFDQSRQPRHGEQRSCCEQPSSGSSP